MNLELFNELWRQGRPGQHPGEWRIFLEICELYLKRHEIRNPIVVEVGSWKNGQKKFYEQLLGATHIGIDITDRYSIPDILGDSHDPKTIEILKKKLEGKPIDIVFIDSVHFYEEVTKDFEAYLPLCNGIIAFHDLEFRKRDVKKFWNELKEEVHMGKEDYKNFLFLSIYQRRERRDQMGIGMIIKK